MRRVFLSIFIVILPALVLLMSGCEAPVLVLHPRLAVRGKELAVAVQVRPAPEDGEYMLFTSSGHEGREWRQQGRFGGRLTALLAGEGALLQVFVDGTVVVIRDEGDPPMAYGQRSRELRLAAAARIGGIPHALDVSGERRILLMRMRGNAWEQRGPALRLLGVPRMVRLTMLDDEPVVLWRTEIGGSIEPGIRCMRLSGDEWRTMQNPPVAGKSVFAVASDGSELLLVRARVNETGSRKRLMQVLRFDGDQWHEVPDGIEMPDNIEGAGINGMDLVLWQGRACFAITDASGLRIFACDDIAAGECRWRLLATPYHVELSKWQMWMSIIVFVAVAIMLIMFNRWAVGRMSGEGKKKLRGHGDLASPLDRAFAMILDGLLVLPLPVGYVLYGGGLDAPEIIKAEQGYLYWIWLGGLGVYLSVSEARWGTSVGKRLFGIQVRSLDYGPISPLQAVMRNLARVVDFWPVVIGQAPVPYLVAMLCVLFSTRRQRFGDTLAGTFVTVHIPLAKREIILASASPRRRELLRETGLEFTVKPADMNERLDIGSSPEENAMRLARGKAERVADACTGAEIVIGADTLVVVGQEAVGKPQDRADARRILSRLSGSVHQVVTAVAVIDRATGRMLVSTEVTEVEMRELSPEEIADYVDSGEADGKAGAYAIQESGDRFVKAVHGSLSNVIGLPMELLMRMLNEL